MNCVFAVIFLFILNNVNPMNIDNMIGNMYVNPNLDKNNKLKKVVCGCKQCVIKTQGERLSRNITHLYRQIQKFPLKILTYGIKNKGIKDPRYEDQDDEIKYRTLAPDNFQNLKEVVENTLLPSKVKANFIDTMATYNPHLAGNFFLGLQLLDEAYFKGDSGIFCLKETLEAVKEAYRRDIQKSIYAGIYLNQVKSPLLTQFIKEIPEVIFNDYLTKTKNSPLSFLNKEEKGKDNKEEKDTIVEQYFTNEVYSRINLDNIKKKIEKQRIERKNLFLAGVLGQPYIGLKGISLFKEGFPYLLKKEGLNFLKI
jgi:hypothetical protein